VVMSALGLGLHYLSHPTLVLRVGTSGSCQNPKVPHRNSKGRFTSISRHSGVEMPCCVRPT
jgi:hypothetical protein